jgi:hypothetical protein
LGQLIDQAEAAVGSPAQRQRLYLQAERRLCEQDTFIIPLLHHYLDH